MDEETYTDQELQNGMDELDASWKLYVMLRTLKKTDADRGRHWAIAATMAEQLHAWLGYVVTLADDDNDG